MANFQPVIKWSGSKRSQADEIIKYFPTNIDTYYEPFIGGGSMLMTLMLNSDRIKVKHYICSDINKGLIDLWNLIKDSPQEVADHYEKLWNEMNSDDMRGDQSYKRSYYENVRERYNKEHDPLDFMFIDRTCFNGLIRYNSKGEFNSPYHLNRNGIRPNVLRTIVSEWSDLLKLNDVRFNCNSYDNISPKCKFEKLALINKSTTNEFINKSNKIHNGKYLYSKTVYVNSKLPVIITCKKHGDFEQTPKTHLKGHGCPKCNQSKMESEVINFLESKHIRYIYQASCKDLKWLSKQSIDFYLPDYGIAVECQGTQHFAPVVIFGGKEGFLTNVKRDISKYYKCISNNIKLLYYIDKSIIEQVIDNKTYNNIYDTTNTFYDLTIFNKKYLENRK